MLYKDLKVRYQHVGVNKYIVAKPSSSLTPLLVMDERVKVKQPMSALIVTVWWGFLLFECNFIALYFSVSVQFEISFTSIVTCDPFNIQWIEKQDLPPPTSYFATTLNAGGAGMNGMPELISTEFDTGGDLDETLHVESGEFPVLFCFFPSSSELQPCMKS